MSHPKFTKLIDYEALKEQYGESDPSITQKKPEKSSSGHFSQDYADPDALSFSSDNQKSDQGLTGTRLRSYAFAVLTRREYSKADLIEKLAMYAQNRDEVIELVNELARENYQSDLRVAEMMLRSQVRKGKGPNRIKLALRSKSLDRTLIQDDLNEIDWYEQAYQLKIKKYGVNVEKDQKLKAKQIRFLQYRGFEMDVIMKAISRKEDEE
ncbi:regulatory protein RecX [Acinetobacter chinensis]|jgi:regulatory protein|uniref:regulatory protein RecX n=1 Tax=Acinetobacter chinensis TaxID=2004650 RepID=UPI002934FE8A|nr:regulatory protein RecX [Acinetobacter chinensis]WOE40172.1 regulatory protein RecX [Acinetobacter chinensis]